MQSTTTRPTTTTSAGAPPVWDLTIASQRRFTPRTRPSRSGPIAASIGAAALCAALLPSVAGETRLLLAVGLGAIGALTGFSALRRRQTRAAALLALVGVLAPVVAIPSALMSVGREATTVTSATVARATLQPVSNGLVPTRTFDGLPADERDAMRALVSATVLQLQTMHGSWAPLPTSLAVSNGALVEADGVFRGTTLGSVPQGETLRYQVADDGSAFRIAVSSSSDPAATIWADRALEIPPSS